MKSVRWNYNDAPNYRSILDAQGGTRPCQYSTGEGGSVRNFQPIIAICTSIGKYFVHAHSRCTFPRLPETSRCGTAGGVE
eukprot:4971820-Pyramimonas_sp.AAC.1